MRILRILRPFRHLLPVFLLVAFVVILAKKGCGPDGSSGAPDAADGTPRAAGPDAPSGPAAAPVDPATAESAVIGLFERAAPSVVHVTALRRASDPFRARMDPTEIPEGTGTGFVWDDRGHVVTNFHVVAEGDAFRVVLADGSAHEARVVGVAPSHDLAVLDAGLGGRVRPLPVASSKGLRVGQSLFAIGNPFGLDQTLTTGVLSGLDRRIRSVTGRPIFGALQTDAAINPGNSGGPLLDARGRVIGVTTAILSPSGASAGIGFAIPSDTVLRVVPEIIRRKGNYRRPVIGVVLLPDAWARSAGIEGVAVEQVSEGGPAAEAGIGGLRVSPDGRLVPGDVVVALDDVPVRVADDLHGVLEGRKIGDEVRVTLVRDGVRRTVTLRLAAGE